MSKPDSDDISKADLTSVNLARAYETGNGEQVRFVQFRAPTAFDFISEAQMPVKIVFKDDGGMEPEFHPSGMTKLMTALSVEPFNYRKLEPGDWLNCAWSLVPFFIPGMRRASEEQPST